MAIKLSDGRFLRITEEGVAAVLGLPNGSVTMTERDTHMVGPDLLAWRCKVKKRNGNIMVHALATLALSLKEGGVWFKRHFCVVVASTLNDYANQKTVHMFKDVRMIKDLDWCGYLLSSLVNTHDSWSQTTARKFPGPLLFLTLFYVDRVKAGERNVPRANPAAHGWPKRSLDAREQQEVDAGGFGYGQLEEPFSTSASQPRCRSSVEQTRYGRADSRPQPVQQGHTPGVSMVSAASRAPTVPSPQGDTTGSGGATGDHPVHHDLIPDANKGFGCELDSMIADLRKVASRVADKGVQVREPSPEGFEPPSFSLGMTQELASQRVEDMPAGSLNVVQVRETRPGMEGLTAGQSNATIQLMQGQQTGGTITPQRGLRTLASLRFERRTPGPSDATTLTPQGVQVREPSPEGFEPPSFSLGMTQELASQRVEDMPAGSLNVVQVRETRPGMEGLTAGPSNATTQLMQGQ
ncbi:PREDICTED: uncharacterized protein LOC109163239 [Ipomoea nil]|uniref:uncharacterized protein LOC109163239 n=1 Tax=Ipomoea nil TaxID=35883 RepID=UPI00090122EB|nr:PREDICTED: uncharacterized protein LOC109163239 [Ipomoea nil]